MLEEEIKEVEQSPQRDFEGVGNFQPFGDSDATTLFQDLERELEKMVQKYRVPPTELENLFQVVQNLFDVMDMSRETYESLVEQKKELEELWKSEKDKSKVAQRRKLELECRMEEEKQRLESENGSLQRDKASLQTKLKQAIEHKSCVEQELIRLKDKTLKDDKARRDLLDTYKRQYDKARRSSLQRAVSLRSSSHRRLPILPHPWDSRSRERVQTTPDSMQSSEDSFPHSAASGTGSGVSEPLGLGVSHTAGSSSAAPLSPPHPNSLETELEREREREDEERQKETEKEVSEREQFLRSNTYTFAESFEEMPMGMQPPLMPPPPTSREAEFSPEQQQEEEEENTESEDEGAAIAPENREGLSLEDELMGAVSPDLLAPARAELEMLQKEKENWQEEKERLEREREEARNAREALEGQYAQLQVEHRQISNKHQEMMEELLGVKKERDEVLEMYLDQPFDDYCITRKELLDLLRRHHKTTIELEKEKEEKKRLQDLLDAKKSFFERLKQSMRRMFNRYPTTRPSTSSGSSDHGRSHTPSDDQLLDTSLGELSPPPAPLTRTIPHSLVVTTNKGWLCSRRSSVSLDNLPHWIGQIPLSGIETERVECAALGRVFSSEETLGGMSTPPRPARFNRRPSSGHHGVQQVHAEVWVATTENSTSFIEIVDILSRTTKVRQRFVVKPSATHIVCMKAIPGSVEESTDFTDSALIDRDTSWVADTFTPFHMQRSYSDSLAGANRGGPWRRGSFSDLSLTPPPGRGAPEGTRGSQLSQSLSLPSTSQGAGQKASGVSAVGEVSGVSRRLDFSLLGSPVRVDKDDTTSVSDQQPLSQSLIVPVRNPDTIAESVDGPGTCPEIVWEAASGQRRRTRRRRRTSSVMRTVMWVVTEDNRLVFYPTTDPSHVPINSVTLPSRALCIEYIKGKVYIGHAQSDISVFHPDEFMQETWDIQNPAKVTLPSSNAAFCYDVKCIAAIGNNEIWVGAGPSIFFLDEQTLERCGSKFIDNWHHRPEQILSVGDLVLVATRASTLYVFDRDQHCIVRRFDVSPVSSLLVSPSPRKPASTHDNSDTPTSIKSLAMDEKSVFIGTSKGCIVTIPIDKLSQKQSLSSTSSPPNAPPSPPQDNSGGENSPKLRAKKSASMSGGVPPRKPPRRGRRSKGTQTAVDSSKKSPLTRVRSSESPHNGGSEENDSSEQEETDTIFLDQSAVSLHCHREKVRTLLHVALPRSRRELNSVQSGTSCFNSMPNLSGSGYRLPLGQPLFKSLVVAIGEGHIEYSTLPPEPEQNVEDASARRERNKSFQLMLWGHRNSIP